MKKLEKIIKEAILEVMAEGPLEDAAKSAELKSIDAKLKALNAQKAAVLSAAWCTRDVLLRS